jgi:G:T/U-mismatch repair DNA glycosylase
MLNPPRYEVHPLEPFLPEGARVLLLGSFPPPRQRWSMEFYYPNMQNDMWRIMGLVFFGDKDHFVVGTRFDKELIQKFLREQKIALGDAAHRVARLRGNASDNFLQVVEPVDLRGLLARIPDCRTIVATGQKAADTLLTLMDARAPKVGGFVDLVYGGREMRFWRMPSSSRAYPKPLDEKAAAYALMLRETLGL